MSTHTSTPISALITDKINGGQTAMDTGETKQPSADEQPPLAARAGTIIVAAKEHAAATEEAPVQPGKKGRKGKKAAAGGADAAPAKPEVTPTRVSSRAKKPTSQFNAQHAPVVKRQPKRGSASGDDTTSEGEGGAKTTEGETDAKRAKTGGSKKGKKVVVTQVSDAVPETSIQTESADSSSAAGGGAAQQPKDASEIKQPQVEQKPDEAMPQATASSSISDVKGKAVGEDQAQDQGVIRTEDKTVIGGQGQATSM